VAAFLFIYAASGLIVLKWIGRKVFHRPVPQRSVAGLQIRAVVLIAAAVGILCGLYARFVEPYWLEETRATFTSPKLSPDPRPVRLALLSDLHCDTAMTVEKKVLAAVAAMKPDAILFAGDGVSSREGIPTLRTVMTHLATIAPTYVVYGNWDGHIVHLSDLYGDTNVKVLDGRPVQLEIGGRRLWLVGAAAWDWAGAERTLRSLPAEEYRIVLYHYTDHIYEAADAGADLYLCGHTHGGQVCLPIYGALTTLARYGKQFEKGRYRVESTEMYVSRGIGEEGGLVPRVRFLSRPEVTLIEISGEPTPQIATDKRGG